MTVRTKICGFTRAKDLDAAIALGVDAVGLNVAKGPRKISVDQATAFVRRCPPFVTTVLLVVDPDLDTALDLITATRCQAIQLHGDEPPDLAEKLRRRVHVLKAFAIAEAGDIDRVAGYPADAYLLDAKVSGQSGGTGRTWDWSLLRRDLGAPVVLAGGLNADNVATAVTATRPWAVDTASGVESVPGIKDPARMAAFLAAVRGAGR